MPGGQEPQHFLNFFPLPHGHGSFRPTFGLPVVTDEGVPRSMVATFDSSLRGRCSKKSPEAKTERENDED